MQVGHHPLLLGHGHENVVGHVPGVRRGVADPLQAGHSRHQTQALGQPEFPIPVMVHVLTEERDLLDALLHAPRGLAQDLPHRLGAFPAAGERNDAVMAGVVAAPDDAEEGLDLPWLEPRKILGLEVAGVADVHLRPAGVHLRTQGVQEPRVSPRAHDEVEERGEGQKLAPQALRHAAGDAQDTTGALVLELAQYAEPAHHLVLGVLANAARVEQHDIGVFGARHHDEARLSQPPPEDVGFVEVHLTAVRFEVGVHKDPWPGLKGVPR